MLYMLSFFLHYILYASQYSVKNAYNSVRPLIAEGKMKNDC